MTTKRCVIFPSLSDTRVIGVNVDSLARAWLQVNPDGRELLKPEVVQTLLDNYHRSQGATWSYGSYLENRRHLLGESYLKETGNFIHLGIDCNVPGGTAVAAPCPMQVVDIFSDGDLQCGWGRRLIMQSLESKGAPLIIFSHLAEHGLALGSKVSRGEVFCNIGNPPNNGKWWPHLHLQCVDGDWYRRLSPSQIENLDGYGNPRDTPLDRSRYPNPERYLF
jgi:hypothetical protein